MADMERAGTNQANRKATTAATAPEVLDAARLAQLRNDLFQTRTVSPALLSALRQEPHEIARCLDVGPQVRRRVDDDLSAGEQGRRFQELLPSADLEATLMLQIWKGLPTADKPRAIPWLLLIDRAHEFAWGFRDFGFENTHFDHDELKATSSALVTQPPSSAFSFSGENRLSPENQLSLLNVAGGVEGYRQSNFPLASRAPKGAPKFPTTTWAQDVLRYVSLDDSSALAAFGIIWSEFLRAEDLKKKCAANPKWADPKFIEGIHSNLKERYGVLNSKDPVRVWPSTQDHILAAAGALLRVGEP